MRSDYRAEVELAESVLVAYEYSLRDSIRQGRCGSAEKNYKHGKAEERQQGANHPYYPPEVYDMVKAAMGRLYHINRNAYGILLSKYSRVSPFYKRQSRSAFMRTQKRRYTSAEWQNDIERSLWFFWQEMKKSKEYAKYFFSTY